MKNLFARFTREEIGQDLVEYALLLGIITVLTVATVQLIGDEVARIYGEVLVIVQGV